ncbi:MAG: HD family phosphohydrolase [Candidatus Bruticola sp.]
MIARFFAKFKDLLQSMQNNDKLIRAAIGLFLYTAAITVLIITNLPSVSKIEVGKPAPWDIKASRSVQIVDEARWNKAKEESAAQVASIEKISPQSLEISKNKISQTFEIIREAQRRHTSGKFTEAEAADISAQVPLDLQQSTVKKLLASSIPSLEQYYTNSEHILGVVMQTGVREDEKEAAYKRIEQESRSLPGLTEDNAAIDAEIARAALIPNKFIDYNATQKAKIQAREQVEPITKTIVPGQIIIREGDIVCERDIHVLEALGLYKKGITWSSVFISCIMVLILQSIACVYIRLYVPQLYANLRLTFGTAALCAVFMVVSHYTTMLSPYLLPIAFTSMLISILACPRLALLSVTMLGIYAGVMTNTLEAAVSVLTTGMVSALAVQSANKRWNVVTASLWVWLTNVLIVVLFALSGGGSFEKIAVDALFYGGLNGLIPALIAAGALPFLEGAFKVTTHIRMLELANPNEAALHELLNKAPGTYMHSIMVANLAEAAAQAIGADSMLCRAGAYYHDLGKMRQPNMFVENQTGHDNPHDKLPPALSAMIVISHVNLGKELAVKYKLPPEIAKFIPEHHGTNLASFFYQKAKAQEDEPVFAEDFRYPGPRPQSKETAIVMICDGIEAASRTLPVPNRENLKNLIDKIVGSIINNHQLDECPLSMRDINTVKASILRSLTSHYHNRVAYPDSKSLSKKASASAPSQAPSQEPSRKEAKADPVAANSTAIPNSQIPDKVQTDNSTKG